MKIQAIDLRMKHRTHLWKVTPLPAPYSLYIEPTSLCNMRCTFCPTGDMKLRQLRPNGMMTLQTAANILAQLREWGIQLRRINWYKDGEPLLNKALPAMIEAFKIDGVVREQWIKTNGLLLEPNLSTLLVDAGLDFLGVSINAVDAAGYLRVTSTRIDYEKLVAGVADFYHRRKHCRLYVKIADSDLTPGEIEKFYRDFEPVADHVAVEQLHGWSASDMKDWTLNTHPTTFEGYPLVEKVACPLPFFMLAINWDGSVSPCNEDWSHSAILGNINEQSLQGIWQGEAVRQFRLMHLEGRRGENRSCAHCSYLATLPDNIDAHRKEMIDQLQGGHDAPR